ncbi:MAG: EamA family transporter [bacterium]
MIYALFAAGLFGIADVFTKIAAVRLKTARITLLNAVLTLPIAVLFFLVFRGTLPEGEYLLRAFIIQGVSAFSFIFFFLAMMTGPVSIVSPIISGYAVISVIGGMVFLGEMPTVMQIAGIALIITGSVTICIEPDRAKRAQSRIWIIWTLLATLCFGIWSLVSKTLAGHVEPWTMTLIFGIIAPFIWAPYIVWRWKKEDAELMDMRGLLPGSLAIVMTIAAAISYYTSLSKLPVSIAAPLTGSHPVFTVLISLTVLKEKFYKFQFVSFAVILTGIYLLR